MAGRILSAAEVFDKIPQQEPFRFVDAIEEISDDHAIGHYRWREDADFYRGHFPGNPITPGVLLVESMAQAGIVALGIYLFSLEEPPEAVEKIMAIFTDAQVDFTGIVRPGETVHITARKEFFRRRKVRSRVEMRLEDGSVVCSGVVSGMGVSP